MHEWAIECGKLTGSDTARDSTDKETSEMGFYDAFSAYVLNSQSVIK